MKKLSIITLIFFCFSMISSQADAQIASVRDSLGGAPVPPEIENPECIGINKEPAHATLMPYASLKEALAADRHASTFCRSLNGMWKFNLVSWPQARPVDFYKTTYDVSSWKEIPVPSNWQLLGYGTPYYRNIGYTFKRDFPKVMSTPPRNFTAYEERNPVGSYRRDFDVPADWNGRQIFIAFDGVDAGFFLWVNGQKVGYSVNSRNVAEFDIGVYKSTVKELLTPYEKPMDAGNHEDVRWVKITNPGGIGIMAQCDTLLLQFTALPYSDEQMENVEYKIDLPQSDATVFCISHRTLGVGSNGCGPRPLPQYMVYTAPATFTYKLNLLTN